MLFANNCNTTLNGGITAVATSMVVTSATGFPAPTGSQYFYCTLADAATQTTIEIVKVTAVSGTTFTIVRGQDGTTGTIFASGAVVSLRLVAASLNDFPKLDEANTFTFAPTFNTALLVTSGGTGLTTLTTGYIPYGNGTGAFSSNSGFSYNGSTLSINSGASNPLTMTGSSGALIASSVTNSQSGATVFLGTGGTSAFGISNWANSAILETTPASTGGLVLSSTTGNIYFQTNNRTTQATLFTSGGVSIGNTTDAGAGNLSVSGDGYFSKKIGINQTTATYSLDMVVAPASANTDGIRVWNYNQSGFLWLSGSSYSYAGVGPNEVWLYASNTSLNIGPDSATGLLKFTTNGAERARIFPSGGVSIGNTTDKGAASLNVSGLIFPQQAATASAPSYVKGAIYFDTTLNKLRVGGATAWETITSI